MKKIDYFKLYTLRSDGRYQAYWRDADGKRHAICDRDPEKLYAKVQQKEKPAQKTFGDWAREWSAERFEVLAPKTVEAYKPILNRILSRFESSSLEGMETYDVNAFLRYIASQGYSRRSVQMHKDITSQIFNYAIAKSATRYNPCDHAKIPSGLPKGTRGIPSDAAIKAVKTRTEHSFALFGLICLYAGLRRGEALALRYEDIDRKRKVIRVDKAVEFVSNTPRIKSPKTEAGKREVILLDVLAEKIPHGSGYIFVNESGELLSRDRYRDRWKSYCKYLGFDITAHQLRHAYATILYEAGIADKDAQDLLGHSNITLTRDVYTHIRTEQKQRTADALNAFLMADVMAETEKEP